MAPIVSVFVFHDIVIFLSYQSLTDFTTFYVLHLAHWLVNVSRGEAEGIQLQQLVVGADVGAQAFLISECAPFSCHAGAVMGRLRLDKNRMPSSFSTRWARGKS